MGSFTHFFFFQAEDGIRDSSVTGVQTCALPISLSAWAIEGTLSGPRRRYARRTQTTSSRPPSAAATKSFASSHAGSPSSACPGSRAPRGSLASPHRSFLSLQRGAAADSPPARSRRKPHGTLTTRQSPPSLATRPMYCTTGQVALAHWSHSAWYASLASPFVTFQTAVPGHKCENVLQFWPGGAALPASRGKPELLPRLCYNSPIDPGHAAVTRNNAGQRLFRRQARSRSAAQSAASSLHRH